ncbi:serine hydrolase domain-containing protein [Chitinophaga japonensis]|uniref:CubicO group peptidase (Beta-lactamase class C family) n=1 Tax=Chitinophaga japonensis TaxID=104662 RepID=A0A562T2T0_CHIJA|nr:serine hydrolase [Chitinophaga japonensis]TWI87935.1 CubicO group peptidase (beta-lactamase class C family) [Chitinophaga japonensis]
MKRILFLSLLLCSAFTVFAQSRPSKTAGYFPPRGEWEHRAPAQLGLDTAQLQAAIRFAQENESKYPRNLELTQAIQFGKEPYSAGIGPFSNRGDATGVIVYKGYIVAEWGEPFRVDITNSVTKSFLSSVVGVAVDQGLIRSVHDTVAPYIPPIEVYDPLTPGGHPMLYPFASAHNRSLTWDVMLRQTSDWEGTLWGKPDWADRPAGNDPEEWLHRKRNTPGSVWKYNDVRVNALALAATCVWRQPLPQVLKTRIMDPIGASNTWRWYGYRNAWIVLDGAPVQSVSGGGHWGGGMFINAYDMARFGLLTLHRGKWNGRQLLSEQWVQQALTPTPAHPTYGYMNWFLNTDHQLLPNAPVTAFVHIGNGTNMVYVDPEHELVAVVRWLEYKAMDGMVKQLLQAVR